MAGTAIADRIETARLILRPPEEPDLDSWAALHADAEATRFIGGVQSRGQSWRSMAAEAGSWRMKGYGMYSVIEKASGAWVGRVGPHWPEGYPGLEVGWAVLRAHWGQGFAKEAAEAAVDEVFRRLDYDQLIHLIDPENLRSIRLAESLGAHCAGAQQLPDPYERFTVECWQLSREARAA